jgi:anaerobic magnesium-protoporphyrin IX monomethyl ester cyclase
MNVLFVYSLQDYQTPAKPLKNQGRIHLGLSYLSSLLSSHGHSTELLVLTSGTKRKVIDDFIEEFQPELVAFTAVASQYDFISEVAEYIRAKYPSIYLVIGGPYVSLSPEGAIHGVFDAVCIGEGEYPLLELVGQLETAKKPTKIRNLWIKDGEGIEKNPTREFVTDLDILPFPDRDMWQKWINYTETEQVILLGRGCPFQCTYCCNHALKKLAPGRYVRLRSPESVLREIKGIVTRFPKTRRIYFEVETIGINAEVGMALCSELEAFNKQLEKPLTFGINLRITPKSDYTELFRAFKRASFDFVNIGLESGSKRIREEALKRDYSNQDVTEAVNLAKAYGLRVNIYVMIGIPGETTADFRETIECVRTCQPDWVYLSIFHPYPGTQLYDLCQEKGLLDHEIETDMERCKAVLDLPGFSKRQIQKEFIWFFYNVYKGHKPPFVTLSHVIRQKAFSSHTLNAIYRQINSYGLFERIGQFIKHY